MTADEVMARSPFYRVLAVDFDGTLTSGGPPSAEVVDALEKARARGLRTILVTGRIVSELVEVWPEALTVVDGVVAENGAVLVLGRAWRLLAEPVDARLDRRLSDAGVSWRRGQVLVAGRAADEMQVVAAIRALELGCQTVVNRSELMVLPAGVSKGTGLYHALGELGLSYHNTIAVGDAENDHALLDESELAVAAANAVESLKVRADVVLARPEGQGVADLLAGDLVSGQRVVHSRRWRLRLGTDGSGRSVDLPASQLNLLVAGGTGAGKSYVAGLLAEQLVRLGYSLLVVDPEGDHVGLSRLPGVLVVGGGLRLPHPDELLRLLHHRYASVVADLSGLEPCAAAEYRVQVFARVAAHRLASGLPHWVLIDEADVSWGRRPPSLTGLEPGEKGYCLVTWRPGDLAVDAVASLDAVIALGSPEPDEATIDLTASVGEAGRARVAAMLTEDSHRALLTRRDRPGSPVAFTPAPRATPHVRHDHKYEVRPLDRVRRFHFRRGPAELTGVTAANLTEFEEELAHCDRAVLAHHCTRGDFSRWVADVFRDADLARRLAEVEKELTEASPGAVVERARIDLIGALESRLP